MRHSRKNLVRHESRAFWCLPPRWHPSSSVPARSSLMRKLAGAWTVPGRNCWTVTHGGSECLETARSEPSRVRIEVVQNRCAKCPRPRRPRFPAAVFKGRVSGTGIVLKRLCHINMRWESNAYRRHGSAVMPAAHLSDNPDLARILQTLICWDYLTAGFFIQTNECLIINAKRK